MNAFLASECLALKDIVEAGNAVFGCIREMDVMYKGGEEVDLGKFNTAFNTGAEECAMLCSGHPTCQFWAFVPRNGSFGTCKLTSTQPSQKQSMQKAHSGSRLCGRVEDFTQSQGKFKDHALLHFVQFVQK